MEDKYLSTYILGNWIYFWTSNLFFGKLDKAGKRETGEGAGKKQVQACLLLARSKMD